MVLTKEMRMAKKEDIKKKAQKAREEALKTMKRASLQRDINLQTLVREELDQTWRETMLKMKDPVIKQDITVMHQTFERVFDKKEFYITHILQLMDVADDQSRRAFASFFEIIYTMINNFVDNFQKKSRENDIKTVELLKTRGNNSPGLKAFLNAESHLQVLMYHKKTTSESNRWAIRGDMLISQDELHSDYNGVLAELCNFLQESYYTMWEEYISFFQSYLSRTALFVRESRKLRKKENEMADIIAIQAKKLFENDTVLARLRSELNSYDCGEYQRAFREKRDCYRAFCANMRSKTAEGCAKDEKQLDILLREADKAVKWLLAARKKAEKILRLAELCRRHETLREKVLPFESDNPETSFETKNNLILLNSKEQAKKLIQNSRILDAGQNLDEDLLVDDALLETCGLKKLWQRISHADLAKRALLREKMLLQRENKAMLQELQIKNLNKKCSCKVSKIDSRGKSVKANN